jgi:hypothetical protein
MPLAKATTDYLDDAPAVGKHVVNKLAIASPKPKRLMQIYTNSCENWTYTASKGKPLLMPSDVCGDINFVDDETKAPTVVTNHKFDKMFKTMYAHIRSTWGITQQEKIGDLATAGKKVRNAVKQELANSMRMIVQATLGHNGFTLSNNNAKTDYAVCTEYERASNQPIYPNHTHSWLEYKGKYCFQTIPDTHLSITQHHAGRPAHAGICRQYVVDFLPDHISAIDDLVANAVEHKKDLVNCNLAKAISTMKLPADMLCPDE